MISLHIEMGSKKYNATCLVGVCLNQKNCCPNCGNALGKTSLERIDFIVDTDGFTEIENDSLTGKEVIALLQARLENFKNHCPYCEHKQGNNKAKLSIQYSQIWLDETVDLHDLNAGQFDLTVNGESYRATCEIVMDTINQARCPDCGDEIPLLILNEIKSIENLTTMTDVDTWSTEGENIEEEASKLIKKWRIRCSCKSKKEN